MGSPNSYVWAFRLLQYHRVIHLDADTIFLNVSVDVWVYLYTFEC